ncbi:carboxylic acid reductase [Mycolicibacterium sp. HK-90]|uniref:carboxylic acid reductase n=1 Tax=Mycolicibacterium sp. HK-90 TaxID=3056937 RepID=UPI002659E8E9|nr:carboxylic acid reductase [Mycolicibacterium sp. HK-90]WKG01260.1 carboxylic acid reductase [Mycolicibacterium sp. HK-90]
MPDSRTVRGRALPPALMPGTAERAAGLYAADRQFRDCLPLAEVSAAVRRDGLGLPAIIGAVMTGYADRPALGTHPVDGQAPATISYRELWTRMCAIAADWHGHGQFPVRPGEFVCMLGLAGPGYTTVDLACALAGAVTAPVPYGAPAAQVIQVLAETRASVLAVGADQLPTAVEAILAQTGVRRLVVFDDHLEVGDARDAFEAARLRLVRARPPVLVETLAEIIRRGHRLPLPPWPAADPDRLVALSYTSGSTGRPRAAMYTERMVANTWRNPVGVPVISYNYLPMSHYGGKSLVLTTLAGGGTAHFATAPDMSTLFEDIAAVRPTVLPLIPRVSEMLFGWYQREYHRRLAPDGDPETVREQVMTELREKVLGGRVLLAASGSAPLSPELTTFIERCLGIHVAVGYGTTETGNVLNDGRVVRPPVIDYKLVDVPELGYFATDRPHPRGELLVKSEILSPGYFRRPDASGAAFDADGYYRTGDIMAEIAPDHLTFVDRRNNVIKLSQGEFVALSHLESVFVASPCVRQIFVYGSGERDFVLAVVVPEHIPTQPVPTRAAILESLRQIARANGLRPYEVPHDIVIDSRPFSTDNGLLTATAKLARPALTARYRDDLERMYTAISERRDDELAALRRDAANSSVRDTVCRAATATLGVPGLNADTVLSDVGVDSLAALTLTALLSDIFGVMVPTAVLLDPALSLAGVATHIETSRRAGRRPSAATVHGHRADRVSADDLTLDRFIAPDVLERAATPHGHHGPPATVLLTGANGFLGQALCIEWLRRLAPTGGRLICLVRGADDAEARRRLGVELGGPGQAALTVLAGDLAEEHLGLDAATWSRLTHSVDLIVHAGAQVNHLAPYPELFGPNVAGTAEVVRLALTDRPKRVVYVSTAAAGTTDDGRPLPEDADVRTGCPVRTPGTAPGSGYAVSKWAGEVLLRQAHDLYQLPVQVFRPGMILAHSSFSGHANVADVFTRMLFSLAVTGIAPRSFYRCPTARPHYDALPVDFVAAVIATLATDPESESGFACYNVVNDHDDAISLDQVVDWLAGEGYPVTRIASHREWATRFETAMRALPAHRRRHSLLPLMAAFTEPAEAVAGSAFPSQRFRAALQAGGEAREIPHVTPDLVRGHLAALRRRGLL